MIIVQNVMVKLKVVIYVLVDSMWILILLAKNVFMQISTQILILKIIQDSAKDV